MSRVLYLLAVVLIYTGCSRQPGPSSPEHGEIVMEHEQLSSKVYSSFHIKIVTKGFPILIYRYSNMMCWSCITEDLDVLLSFQEKIGREHVLILPAYPDDRDNRIRLANELSKFNYRNVPVDSLIIPDDEIAGARRYLALINADDEMDMLFFPRKDHPELTQRYLSEIESYFKSHNQDK